MSRPEFSDQGVPRTRVLVVEDQRVLADALTIAIGGQPDLECVGAAGTVDEALRLIRARRPDVALMDIHLPGVDGITGTRQIKASYPEIRVFILTADTTPDRFTDAAEAGAAGFLAKDSAFPDVLAAIRTPPEGRIMVAGSTVAALLGELRRGVRRSAAQEGNWAALTEREREVLALMGEGMDPRAIAARLVVSLHTARGHVKKVMTKLGTHSQLEAVVVAIRTGLLPGPNGR
jgi:DNA-binding NarL/FixJ family response regulator